MTAAMEPAAADKSALADETAFADLTEQHRRELHVHCYRMLASFDEAEDAVQETFLRAWRSRDRFDGSSLFRAWLDRIAMNVCLDMTRRNSRRLTTMGSFAEVPWLRELPAQAGRLGVPRVQVRRAAHRGRQDRRDHDLRGGLVPNIRSATDHLRAIHPPRPRPTTMPR